MDHAHSLSSVVPMVGDCLASRMSMRVPNAVRMRNYCLGGKDNFRVDREAVQRVIEKCPHVSLMARANRRFLIRAARFCALRGVTQFVEFGVGIPMSPSVAETVRVVHPESRIVGVDCDPVALCHARALVDDGRGVRVVEGSLQRPGEVLDDPVVRELTDFAEPVAFFLVGVTESLLDDQYAASVVKTLGDRMAPGSFLVLSHASSTGSAPEVVDRYEEVYAGTTQAAVFRRRDQIHDLLQGFELVTPGLVDIQRWRPERGLGEVMTRMRLLGAVGRRK